MRVLLPVFICCAGVDNIVCMGCPCLLCHMHKAKMQMPAVETDGAGLPDNHILWFYGMCSNFSHWPCPSPPIAACVSLQHPSYVLLTSPGGCSFLAAATITAPELAS